MLYGKITERLPPIRRPKLSKKEQYNEYGIYKIYIYKANGYCSDWRFQLHWYKLEWINPISKIKREKPYSVSSKIFYINKVDRTSYWVGYSDLK